MYYLESRYYDPQTGRFLNADSLEYLGDGEELKNYNLFTYCGNNPVRGYDPEGTADWGSIGAGALFLGIGLFAMAIGVSVLTCGVATPLMIIVATGTVATGAVTAVNGVAEIGEAVNGYNFMKDGLFQGNKTAYNIFAGAFSAVALYGSAVCGSWTINNMPRIKAYKYIEKYSYTNTISNAAHMSRPYSSSLLMQKQVIKYGNMTYDPFGYVFSTMGKVNGKKKLWRLGINIGKELVWHWGHGF